MTERDQSQDAEYGSHMPVLIAALKHYKPKTILEIGCGHFSTPLLFQEVALGSAERLTVVEQSDVGWLDDIKKSLGEHEGVTYDFLPTSTEVFANHGTDWDFVFVDGETSQRRHAIQLALNADVPVVIFHDSEKYTWYGYDHIWKPDHYQHFHYQCVMPDSNNKCTCVVSHDTTMLQADGHQVIYFYMRPPDALVDLP